MLRSRVVVAMLAAQLVCATTVCAQALVPPKGEGAISITYQNYYVIGHYDVFGRENSNGGTHSQAVVTELDYAVTDTIGLTVSLPFIASKYTGGPSYFVGPFETFPGPLDDGSYHGAIQDLRVEVRRMFTNGPLAVTPFIGASFPTHDYETVGEAVPGRHRRELQLGAHASLRLDDVLPRTYANLRYAYATAQRINGFPATHSAIDVEGGYELLPRLALRGLAAWQIRHRGPRPPDLAFDWRHHDRFIVSSFFNLGGGTSVLLTRSTELYALWVVTVSGHDGAHRARTLAIGTTFGFGGGLGRI